MESVDVAAQDVLKALKRFKRLAKQDLLASEHTPNPAFWKAQAESRRRVYDQLMDRIRDEGVTVAYQTAVEAYAALPLHRAQDTPPDENEAVISGQRQALELFFHLLGEPGRQVLEAAQAQGGTVEGVRDADGNEEVADGHNAERVTVEDQSKARPQAATGGSDPLAPAAWPSNA